MKRRQWSTPESAWLCQHWAPEPQYTSADTCEQPARRTGGVVHHCNRHHNGGHLFKFRHHLHRCHASERTAADSVITSRVPPKRLRDEAHAVWKKESQGLVTCYSGLVAGGDAALLGMGGGSSLKRKDLERQRVTAQGGFDSWRTTHLARAALFWTCALRPAELSAHTGEPWRCNVQLILVKKGHVGSTWSGAHSSVRHNCAKEDFEGRIVGFRLRKTR